MKDQTTYEIRELGIGDLINALALVYDVFMEFDAPDYSEQGIKTFVDSIEYNSIINRIGNGTLKFWACFDGEKVAGVIAVKQTSHISLLFVDKNYHKQGIGRRLFKVVVDMAKENMDIKEITVNSSPYAVEVYHRLSFQNTNTEQTINGIRFTPMKYQIIRE